MFKLLHLGVAKRLLEMKKKWCVEEKIFFWVLQCVKQEKKILNKYFWFYWKMNIYIYIYKIIFLKKNKIK